MAKNAKTPKAPKGAKPEFRSEALAAALESQDVVQVALALRNGRFVVPLMAPPASKGATGNPGTVWTYRDPESGKVALLLFSDAKNKPEGLPKLVGLHDGPWLHEFLRIHADEIETVFFDIAGPAAMQASPAEILRALDL